MAEEEPQEGQSKKPNFGRLKHGNPPCDLRLLPRCKATAKSTGKRCEQIAMKGKRVCYIHGGKSTGPRTKEGLLRSKYARLKHGDYSAETIKRRHEIHKFFHQTRDFLKCLKRETSY